MIASINASPAGTLSADSSAANPTDQLANTQTFLKLLIAQIRNQNPLNPTDGIQFVSQLAEFSTLEQNVQIRETLSSILNTLETRLPNPPADPKG